MGCDCEGAPIDKTDGGVDGGDASDTDAEPDSSVDAGPDIDVGDVCGDGVLGITGPVTISTPSTATVARATARGRAVLLPHRRRGLHRDRVRRQRSEANEQCDDGNDQDGDGCSSICALEPGWVCPSWAFDVRPPNAATAS